MKPLLVLLVLSLIVIAPVVADDPPKLPMAVDGFVTINGNPAPIGAVIVAHATNVYPGTATITLTETGKFGSPGDPFAERIFVQGTKSGQVPDGEPVTFTVNGASAYVRISGTTSWGTSVPYAAGGMVFVDISTGALPVSTTTPTPVPTMVQPTQVPTPVPTTIVPTMLPTQYHSTKAVISRYNIPKPDCPDSFYYGVPSGYGVLQLSGSGSSCFFYVDDALVVNGGGATLKGMKPGIYTISYEEAGCLPFERQIEVMAGQITRVDIKPYFYAYGIAPEWKDIYPEYVFFGGNTGSFTMLSSMRGIDICVDDDCYTGNQTPCDMKFTDLKPGIHTVRYTAGDFVNEFKIIVCAGTDTRVSGGLPVSGVRCEYDTCVYTSLDGMSYSTKKVDTDIPDDNPMWSEPPGYGIVCMNPVDCYYYYYGTKYTEDLSIIPEEYQKYLPPYAPTPVSGCAFCCGN